MIRKALSVLFWVVCFFCASAQEKFIVFDKPVSSQHNTLTVNRFDTKGISLTARFDTIAIANAETLKGDFCELQIAGAYRTGAIGEPQLPAIRKLVKIPRGTILSTDIKCSDTAFYSLPDVGFEKKIAPRQPSQSKSSTRAKYKHKKRSYKRNYFTDQQLVAVTKVGTMRDMDYYQISVNPVRYNPKQNKIEIFNNINIDIKFKENPSKSAINTSSPFFESSKSESDSTYSDLTKYPVKYLIITHSDFIDSLQDFIHWKRQKGFDVIVATTDSIGSSAAAIKAWVASQYNSATNDSPAPSFLLLAADTDKIPCSQTGESSGKGTDLYYACMDGADDIIPDLYYGRFSARTASQIKAMADKTIAYEKFQFTDSSYLAKATLIAGYDASYRASVGIPTLNYITRNRINANNGYKTVNKFTNSYTNCYADTSVSVGLMTYTAPGTSTTWVNPELTQTKVNNFSNSGKFPFVIANCCYSGNLTTTECLGETWLRKKDGGAVAYIGSAPQSWWQEDFYWAVGAHNYKSGVCPDTSATTIGAFDAPFVSDFNCGDALVFAGNLAVSEAHDNNYSSNVSTRYYWEAYSYFGDPSLLVYFGIPRKNNVSYEQALPIGVPSVTVEAEAGSYVAISKDSTLLGAAIVKRGQTAVTISIPAVTEPGPLTVVVTKAQRKPHFGHIELIVPNRPYIILSGAYTNRLTNDSTLMLNLALRNISQVVAKNAKIDGITSSSEYVKSITPINYSIGQMLCQTTDTIAACLVELHKNIPDQTQIPFIINVSDSEKFVFNYKLTIAAPHISFQPNVAILRDSVSSTFMPGDTVDLGITITNKGHVGLSATTLTLKASVNQPYINIIDASSNIDTLGINESATCYFKVAADTDTDIMSEFYFDVSIANSDASYHSSAGYAITIGKPFDLQIGNGSESPKDYPFNNYYECSITDILYTTEDLGDKPMKIKTIGFDLSQATPASEKFSGYLNFTIKAKPVSNTELSNFIDMSDAETLYTQNKLQLPTSPEHFTFELNKDYNYDGKTNFAIEIKWGDNNTYVPEAKRAKLHSHSTSSNTVAYGIKDEWSELEFDGCTKIRPNTTFGYIPCNKAIIFDIKDTDNLPVANAQISILDETMKTDSTGTASYLYFNRLYNETCRITAANYYNHDININTTGDTTYISVTLTPLPRNSVTIHLTDARTGADIAGATINVDSRMTTITNQIGEVVLLLTQSQHQLNITSTDYITVSDCINVTADGTIAIKMWQKPCLTVRTEINGSPIANTAVIIAGDTITTNTDGSAAIGRIAPGQYNICLSHNDYITTNHTVKIGNADIDTTFTLTELPDVTFVIYADNKLTEGVTVTLDDRVQTTDSYGVATFKHVREGQHNYIITGNLITKYSGTITTSTTNTTITKRLEKQRSTLVFNITDDGKPIEGIGVIVYGQTVRTNNAGTAIFRQLVPVENLSYTITNESSLTVSGATAVDTDTVFVNIDITKDLVNIEFFVFDINRSPIAKASINLNNNKIETDQNGKATFSNIKKGSTLNYTISKDNYDKVTGSVTCDSSFTVSIMMIQPGQVRPVPHDTSIINTFYSLTFLLTDGSKPLFEGEVTVNGIEKMTDSLGIVRFDSIAAETPISYIAKVTGYTTIDGQPELSDTITITADTSITISFKAIELPPPPVSVNENAANGIFVYPNPSDGLLYAQNADGQKFSLIDKNGRTLKIGTIDSGQIDLRPITAGTYTLIIKREGRISSTQVVIY